MKTKINKGHIDFILHIETNAKKDAPAGQRSHVCGSIHFAVYFHFLILLCHWCSTYFATSYISLRVYFALKHHAVNSENPSLQYDQL